MAKPALVFLHGLESGPHGSKYHALLELDRTVLAPDCSGMDTLPARLEVITKELRDIPRMVLVGSSFGGLAALLYAQRPDVRGRIHACVLCAPAFSLPETAAIESLPPRVTVLHGRQDDIVPLQCSEDFCARHPAVRLVVVDDDHRLSASRELMVNLVREALG